jgi:hypothetical protein
VGVDSVSLGDEGIQIHTSAPHLLPKEIEGLPVIALPPEGPYRVMSHTDSTRIRPIHGGVLIQDNAFGLNRYGGTLSIIGLSQGEPFLVFPSHLLDACYMTDVCQCALPPGLWPLNMCPRNTKLAPMSACSGTHIINQPPVTNRQAVGFAQRWTRLAPYTSLNSSIDAASAFIDTDTIEGNNSLCANRYIETYGTLSGSEGTPSVGLPTTSITGLDPHTLYSVITGTVSEIGPVYASCMNGVGNNYTKLRSMIRVEISFGWCFKGGDSGSPLFDSGGRFPGSFSAAPDTNPCVGYFTSASALRQYLYLDGWYGAYTSGASQLCN